MFNASVLIQWSDYYNTIRRRWKGAIVPANDIEYLGENRDACLYALNYNGFPLAIAELFIEKTPISLRREQELEKVGILMTSTICL
ncbi:hypothetical protein FRC03_012888 [Tulasnella sp. 419]|nr:hypothetical protein FRC03_012888 [Tulasnella sp. 419]